MTEPKNPAPTTTDSNELSDEELEAASGGALNQPRLNTALSSQKVIAPVDVKAGALPPGKDSLL